MDVWRAKPVQSGVVVVCDTIEVGSFANHGDRLFFGETHSDAKTECFPIAGLRKYAFGTWSFDKSRKATFLLASNGRQSVPQSTRAFGSLCDCVTTWENVLECIV